MKDTLQNIILNKKIEALQLTIDSINKASKINQLQFEVNQKQNLISQIDTFYNSAWLKLIIVITLLGILLPIIAQYFQRRNLKDLTEFISKQLNDSFDTKIEELKLFNKIQIEESVKKLNENLVNIEKENQNLLIELDASTFYLQGRTTFQDKRYQSSIPDFLKSALLWLTSKRPERCLVQINNIVRALKQINSPEALKSIDTLLLNSKFKATFEELIEQLVINENKDLYIDQIGEIKSEIERIKKPLPNNQ